MRRSAGVSFAVCLLWLGCAGATADSRTNGATPVLTAQGAIRQLAVSAGRVAWIDPSWRLHLAIPGTSRRTTTIYTQRRFVNQSDPFAQWPELAFAGSRPIWADARGTPEILESVYSTDRQGGLRALARLRHYDGIGGGTGNYLLAVAGDPSGGAYSWTHVQATADGAGRNSGGGIWTVGNATSRRVPGLRAAVVLSRSGSRLALAPTRTTQDDVPLPESDDADPTVEIATVQGRVIATYHAQYEVQALAITSRFVFVEESRTIVDPIKGGTAILSAQTGKLLRWLPGKGGANLSANGRYAAFSSLDKVFLLDGATGKITRIAVVPSSKSKIVNAVLDGETIWWAVATQTRGSQGDANDEADFTTTVYRQARR